MAEEQQLLSISVRQLVQYVHREGGLSPLQFSGLEALQGSRLHQTFFKAVERLQSQGQEGLGAEVQAPGPGQRLVYTGHKPAYQRLMGQEYQSEYSLQAQFSQGPICLQLRGRADLLIRRSQDILVSEVKTVAAAIRELDPQGRKLHWAQLRIYAFLYGLEQGRQPRSPAVRALSPKTRSQTLDCPESQPLSLALDYLSAENMELLHIEEGADWEALEDFFVQSCQAYLDFANNYRLYLQQRDQGLRELRFPYPEIREGQREFMEWELRQLHQRQPLLIQAPTGIGKTISSLYPALKGLARGFHERIFYLTAKTSTRLAAEKALDDLLALPGEAQKNRDEDGGQGPGRAAERFSLRRLTLTAKEQICLCPELYCDLRLCPYAQHYYQHLQAGLAEVLAQPRIGRQLLQKAGQRHKLCPFELGLDAALYCDVIIGDYNHAFDPRVRLDRFFATEDQHHALLIDEAHNLPDRMRRMYSASIGLSQVQDLLQKLPGWAGKLRQKLLETEAYMLRLREAEHSDLPLFTDVENKLDPEMIISAEGFRGLKKPGPGFLKLLRPQVLALRPLLEQIEDPLLRRPVLDYFFSLRFFLRAADEFFGRNYIFCAHRDEGDWRISLLCLDPSERVQSLYLGQHSPVFFSATLSPLPFFARLLCGPQAARQCRQVQLHSPFPPENCQVLVQHNIETSYRLREASLPLLCRNLAELPRKRPGRYLIFFPSYAYMERCLAQLSPYLEGLEVEVQVQRRHMDEAARRQYLLRFYAHWAEDQGLRLQDLAPTLYQQDFSAPPSEDEGALEDVSAAFAPYGGALQKNSSLPQSGADAPSLEQGTEEEDEDLPDLAQLLPPEILSKLQHIQARQAASAAEKSDETESGPASLEAEKSGGARDQDETGPGLEAGERPQRSLLSFALMGGIFGEGIDLVGEALNGVAIVGVGLPQLCPERELMRLHYEQQDEGMGYAFAYQFPGFNRVLQAAGRLIRSETDRGVIVLLDSRFARPDYQALFPEDWNLRYVDSPEALGQALEACPY